VGVNAFVEQNEPPIELLHIDESSQQHQLEKLKSLKSRRSNEKVTASLAALKRAAEGRENTMPYILDCVRAYATLGEICDAFRDVFGTYTETSVL
jgi:methylmalonyl-CoA mutase N-terminal domain/subunit